MNTENLSELRVPELPDQAPEGLAPLLNRLERAMTEDRPFAAARAMLEKGSTFVQASHDVASAIGALRRVLRTAAAA